ncbi:hypothetical protein [Novosphingobium sp. B1]|uniref:hypothetical protein n=1 Tax=Novosphingobium sp. B1 TaxID=1938756 RepID=UPI00111C7F05|nr:hypothetical protein [Novosphingobium sp. B1]
MEAASTSPITDAVKLSNSILTWFHSFIRQRMSCRSTPLLQNFISAVACLTETVTWCFALKSLEQASPWAVDEAFAAYMKKRQFTLIEKGIIRTPSE